MPSVELWIKHFPGRPLHHTTHGINVLCLQREDLFNLEDGSFDVTSWEVAIKHALQTINVSPKRRQSSADLIDL